ncbi:MAG: hypothetical protein KF686_05350 [Ramlibacter sp.]|nr:hypothetical protein [Ramlibacter sp.]
MKPAFAPFLIALCVHPAWATGPNEPQTAATAGCPAPEDLLPVQLYGLWQVTFDRPAGTATVLFEKHPEYAGGLRGAINRDGERSALAGDVDNGVLALDETENGLQISAVWSGTVSPNSCGKEITGLWRRSKDNQERSFVLRKLPGWR